MHSFRCQNNGPVYIWRGTETSGCLEPVMLVLAGINCNVYIIIV